ncbi:hypothetical protein Lal_00040419 [Lupinus albus]|nr:hypothetical protein Lal_00040419 [Lupinus albus]
MIMENLNPNVNVSTPIKSSKESEKWVSKKNTIVAMRQRKFVKVSKNKTDAATAYQNLRVSQEEFFKNRCSSGKDDIIEEEFEGISKSGILKRKRERVLEEARNSVPENGVGRVKHFVKAFESILNIPNSIRENQKVMKWALPGLQNSQYKAETDVTHSSLFSASDLVLTSHNLGFNQRVLVSSSLDGRHSSVASRTSSRGKRSRRNSLESSRTVGGRRWKKKQHQIKVTSQKPFKLRTEQRGKMKEEEFMNKIQQMMTEEEKLRIPIAQGLPWTTDEAECLVKPPVKESTKLIDLKLHSDVRAIDRAEFDHQMAEKMSMMEQYRLERERQQKLAEEEEIRRLRKELVPKAQPMPYFDRPFVPMR